MKVPLGSWTPELRGASTAGGGGGGTGFGVTDGAHALAVLTEWDEFRDLDFELIYRSMKKPAFAFDGRNVLPHAQLRGIGFEVSAIGKSVLANSMAPIEPLETVSV